MCIHWKLHHIITARKHLLDREHWSEVVRVFACSGVRILPTVTQTSKH